jgi:hypothetical protein
MVNMIKKVLLTAVDIIAAIYKIVNIHSSTEYTQTISTYIHTYMHAHTHTYIHTNMNTYIHTYMQT